MVFFQVNTETGAIRPVIRLEVARNSRRYKKKEELDKEEPGIIAQKNRLKCCLLRLLCSDSI